jgi:hypothetical protein
MPTAASSRKPVVHFLRTYKFSAEEKDPIIDRIRTLMEDEGVNANQVHVASGVAATTIYNWLDGPTRRPQYATTVAVIRSMGYDFAIVRSSHKANGEWRASAPLILKRHQRGV